MYNSNELITIITQIEDYLIPFLNLDTYEKTLYYHLFRHSRLIGKEAILFVISNAPKTVGLTDFSARDRIRKLDKKGCIKIQEITRTGLLIKVFLPNEIKDCVVEKIIQADKINIEEADFYKTTDLRLTILERENNKCFYCFKNISKENYVLDHLTSQVNSGNNSYRNIVATCHECNSKKTWTNWEDFARNLYRNGFLSSNDLDSVILKIEKIKNGELVPIA